MIALVKMALSIGAGRFGGLIFQAAALAILARSLLPREFASLMAVTGVMVFVAALADLGVTSATTRSVAEGDWSKVDNLATVNITASLLFGSLAAGSLALASVKMDYPWSPYLAVLGLWVFFDRLADFKLAEAIGGGRATYVSATLGIRKIVPLGAVAFCGIAFEGDRVGIAYLIGLTCGSGLAAALRRPIPESPPPRRRLGFRAALRRGVLASLPFWLNTAAAQSRQLDVALVGMVGGPVAAVPYAPVARLISPLRLLPTSLAQAVLASGRGVSGRKLLGCSFGLGIALFGSIALVAEHVIRLALGPQYLGSVVLLQVILIGLVFAAVASTETSLLQRNHQEKLVGILNLFAALFTLAAIAAGSLLASAVGAAVGLSVGYLAQATLLTGAIFIMRRRRGGVTEERATAEA